MRPEFRPSSLFYIRRGASSHKQYCCRPSGRLIHSPETKKPHNGQQHGYSLLELLVTLMILSIAFATAVSNLKTMNRPLHNGAQGTMGFFKQARAKAISTTQAYFVAPTSDTHLKASYGSNCSDSSPTTDQTLFYDLPTGAKLSNTSWSVCFSSRGLANTSQDLTLVDSDSKTKTIQVFLGGAVRVQ